MFYEFKYKNKNTSEISFPLGGIGTGSIGLAGNGKLIDFENRNGPAKGNNNEFSMFSVKVVDKNQKVYAKALMGDSVRELQGRYVGTSAHYGFGYGPFIENCGGFPHFKNVEFLGNFPIAQMTFSDDSFPGEVKLIAFNPLIPLDSDASSLPAAFFEVEFINTTDEDLEYTVALNMNNPLEEGENRFFEGDGFSGINMYQTALDSSHYKYGDTTILTDQTEGVTYQESWFRGEWFDSQTVFWSDFATSNPLKNRRYDTPKNEMCTLAVTFNIKKGESKKAKFVYAWNYPNCVNSWANTGVPTEERKTWKNYYATIFKDSKESAKYCLNNFESLLARTQNFVNTIYDSTLPKEVIEAAVFNLSVLKTAVVLRLEDGSFYGWEGLSQCGGSCEGSCNHVWNYAYALCFLFPDLERSMRDLDFKYNLQENGWMYFRLSLPIGEKRTVHTFACVDGTMGAVIKTYRDWKLCGDNEWLKGHWNDIKRTLEFAWNDKELRWDSEKKGILTGRQHHTLDVELFGPSGWLQSMYLAALKAAAEMAEFLGDTDAKDEYLKIFNSGKKWCEENLFNGEYFIQKVDLNNKEIPDSFECSDYYWNDEAGEIKYQIDEGSSIDQVLGQWHANICGLGEIFDNKMVKSALKSIYKYNFIPTMRDFHNPCRLFCLNDESGTVMCAYPDGVRVPKIPIPYTQECMTGFEYQVAEHMISEGLLEEGLTLVRAVRNRYDGQKRNPWSELECGSNYARSMASFGLLPIFSRFEFDLPKSKIGFNPIREGNEDFKCFFSIATGWGSYEVSSNKTTITIGEGELNVKLLHLPYLGDGEYTLNIDGDKQKIICQDGCVNLFKNVEKVLEVLK